MYGINYVYMIDMIAQWNHVNRLPIQWVLHSLRKLYRWYLLSWQSGPRWAYCSHHVDALWNHGTLRLYQTRVNRHISFHIRTESCRPNAWLAGIRSDGKIYVYGDYVQESGMTFGPLEVVHAMTPFSTLGGSGCRSFTFARGTYKHVVNLPSRLFLWRSSRTRSKYVVDLRSTRLFTWWRSRRRRVRLYFS